MNSIENITFETMWEAVISSNNRFDEIFYYAVKTTGIYCKPSCKSKIPLQQNVLFFYTKNDALEKGYRPCKRCRPDLHNQSIAILTMRSLTQSVPSLKMIFSNKILLIP